MQFNFNVINSMKHGYGHRHDTMCVPDPKSVRASYEGKYKQRVMSYILCVCVCIYI